LDLVKSKVLEIKGKYLFTSKLDEIACNLIDIKGF
jgi:hypothetical protein